MADLTVSQTALGSKDEADPAAEQIARAIELDIFAGRQRSRLTLIKAPYRREHFSVHAALFSAVFNGGNGGFGDAQLI